LILKVFSPNTSERVHPVQVLNADIDVISKGTFPIAVPLEILQLIVVLETGPSEISKSGGGGSLVVTSKKLA